MEILFEIAGFLGVFFYISAYALLQFGVIKGSSYAYTIMNLLASVLVLVSLVQAWNRWSAIVQISWITISIVGMTRMWLVTRGLRFNAEERRLIEQRFATMRPVDARKILNAGAWYSGEAGDMLTQQAAPVKQLSYLADGGADVYVNGRPIAMVQVGDFVGEIACLDSGPASATVRLSRASRYFTISSDMLRQLVKRNPELGPHLDYALSSSVSSKLLATNARLESVLKERNTCSDLGSSVSEMKPAE